MAAVNMMAMGEGARSAVDDVIGLAAGRAVGVAEHGDPSGEVVFLLHGTPASRVGFGFAHEPARARRVRLVCPDRPGIGRSDPDPGVRRVVDYAGELEALADAMGVERFSVIGYSGGSGFALAAAAGLGDRVKAVALVAGVGPLDRPGGRASLALADRVLLELCERRPRLAAAVLRASRRAAQLGPRAALAAFRADLPDADRRFLDRDERGPALVQSFLEALRRGPGGVIDDYRIPARPWGFDLGDVAHAVDLWHGDEDDVVPLARAEDLAGALPHARMHRVAGEGHISIQGHLGAALDEMLGSAPS